MEKNKDLVYHISETDPRTDFLYVRKFLYGLGLDIGIGSNRLSPTVLGTDWYPHPTGVDILWNCVHEGKRMEYPFREETFDFVFASHVIEDFAPDEIQFAFDEFLRMVKKGGHLVILIPDMENKRYPDWDEVFTADDDEVKSGKRQVGEKAGNPSHLVHAGETLMNKLAQNSVYQSEVVQVDTIPHESMSLDFVVKKI